MKSEYTASNCSNYRSVSSDHLNSENIPLEGLDVNSFDFQIYWQPSCGSGGFTGIAEVGGTKSLVSIPLVEKRRLLKSGGYVENTGKPVDSAAAVLAHELGHNFGAQHASCISDNNRGAVAWCDSDVTKSSNKFSDNPCNVAAADWSEYCSPHSLMGAGDITKPFYMDGKLTFDEMKAFFAAIGASLNEDEFKLIVGEMFDTVEASQLATHLAALAGS